MSLSGGRLRLRKSRLVFSGDRVPQAVQRIDFFKADSMSFSSSSGFIVGA
jgi:hypothetical protein